MRHWSRKLEQFDPCEDGLAYAKSHDTMQGSKIRRLRDYLTKCLRSGAERTPK